MLLILIFTYSYSIFSDEDNVNILVFPEEKIKILEKYKKEKEKYEVSTSTLVNIIEELNKKYIELVGKRLDTKTIISLMGEPDDRNDEKEYIYLKYLKSKKGGERNYFVIVFDKDKRFRGFSSSHSIE